MLAPHIFGIFTNDLLIDLSASDHGVRIGSNKFRSFAYADDINLFSATVLGLQKMIDKCLALFKHFNPVSKRLIVYHMGKQY